MRLEFILPWRQFGVIRSSILLQQGQIPGTFYTFPASISSTAFVRVAGTSAGAILPTNKGGTFIHLRHIGIPLVYAGSAPPLFAPTNSESDLNTGLRKGIPWLPRGFVAVLQQARKELQIVRILMYHVGIMKSRQFGQSHGTQVFILVTTNKYVTIEKTAAS